MHGKGKITYNEGSYFEGNFINGKKHGYGELIQEDSGYYYKGNWENDKMHGTGIEFFPQ